MQFDRMMLRCAAIAILSISVLWAQMPEVFASDAPPSAQGGIGAQTKLARVTNNKKKKKMRKAKRPKKASRKSRKKAVPA